MSDYTDDVVEGRCCSWCGVYFIEGHEYPVICNECAKGATVEDMANTGVARATKAEL